MAQGNRTWTPAETRLIAEYLAARWPGRRTMQRVRVGRLHPDLVVPGISEEEQQSLGVWRRWVDAVIFDPPRILLVEGAIKPDPGDVSQLELYMHLWPTTPEFVEFQDWPVQGLLVYAIDDPIIRRLAGARGFLLEIFSPPWIADYLLKQLPRNRRAPLTVI